MPDLVTVAFWRCATESGWERTVIGSKGDEYTVRFDKYSHRNPDVECDYSCTCPGYEYRGPNYCKHILQVRGERCGWNQWLHGGEPEVDAEGVRRCPLCGVEVEAFSVGV